MIPARSAVALVLCAGLWGCSQAEAPSRAATVMSDTFEIDRIYPSMKGPSFVTRFTLSQDEAVGLRELLWLRGYRAEITGEDGTTPKSQQYMCHSTMRTRSAGDHHMELTLAQGQHRLDLPEGFGVPIMSDYPLDVFFQVLNLHQTEGVEQVREKVRIEYLRDSELSHPLKPLVMKAAFVMVSLEGRPIVYGEAEDGHHGEHNGVTCLPGEDAAGSNQNEYVDSLGRRFSGHFVVPPGRHVYRTLATERLDLGYDTTIHYVAAHLHPFAEWIELNDLTTGETVYRANAVNVPDGIGLAEVDHYSSQEGLPVYADHQYEIASSYNNTSGQNQDAMAVLFLYVLDKEFRPPGSSAL